MSFVVVVQNVFMLFFTGELDVTTHWAKPAVWTRHQGEDSFGSGHLIKANFFVIESKVLVVAAKPTETNTAFTPSVAEQHEAAETSRIRLERRLLPNFLATNDKEDKHQRIVNFD